MKLSVDRPCKLMHVCLAYNLSKGNRKVRRGDRRSWDVCCTAEYADDDRWLEDWLHVAQTCTCWRCLETTACRHNTTHHTHCQGTSLKKENWSKWLDKFWEWMTSK